MMTEKQAKARGYYLTRGAYRDTADDRLDRWYWDRFDNDVVDRRGAGFVTKRDALEALEQGISAQE